VRHLHGFAGDDRAQLGAEAGVRDPRRLEQRLHLGCACATVSPAMVQRSTPSVLSAGYAGSCVPPSIVLAWMLPRP